jgi:hypothetical protein
MDKQVMIRNCTFAFKCSVNWDNLEETDEENIRFCLDCQKEVHFCEDDEDLVRSIKLNRCIAISRVNDFGEIRTLGLPCPPDHRG